MWRSILVGQKQAADVCVHRISKQDNARYWVENRENSAIYVGKIFLLLKCRTSSEKLQKYVIIAEK